MTATPRDPTGRSERTSDRGAAPLEASPRAMPRLDDWLPHIARVSPLFLALTYCLGFVVVTAFRAHAGLPFADFLDARHLAGGALFVLFLLLSAAVAWGWERSVAERDWELMSESAKDILFLARVLVNIAWLQTQTAFIVWRNIPLVVLDALRTRRFLRSQLSLALRLAEVLPKLWRSSLFLARRLTLGAVRLALILATPAILSFMLFGGLREVLEAPSAWAEPTTFIAFTAIIMLAGRYALRRARSTGPPYADAALPLAFGLLFLMGLASAFGVGIYPKLPAEYGGGRPVEVVVYLRESIPLPRAVIEAFEVETHGREVKIPAQLFHIDRDTLALSPPASDAFLVIRRDDALCLFRPSNENN